ncbi:MAG: hypothetical protein FJ194_05560 [Gammaproteobacteria bacterium]|nr:hypothetical protein [Gammaproteobacteria bacterium]
MSRIRLLADAELDPNVREQVLAVESAGKDASVLRAVGHRQDMFDKYFQFYYPTHNGGVIEPVLKELVRLRIARLNDCFT